MAEATATKTKVKPGKYLTFKLANEEYGLEIHKVREIICMMDITALPRTPDFVKGVTNLRGKVIPVIDLRLRFQLPEKEHTATTCIIVVEIVQEGISINMGVIVDSVLEVLNVNASDLADTPKFGVKFDYDFILGLAKCGGTVKTLIDIDWVLVNEELRILAEKVNQ